MRTTHGNKSLPGELGEDIVVKYYKRGSPEAAMPIMTPNLLILSYLKGKECNEPASPMNLWPAIYQHPIPLFFTPLFLGILEYLVDINHIITSGEIC